MHQQSRWTATPSGLSGAPTTTIPTIFMQDALSDTTLPIYPYLGQAPDMLACIPSGLVLHKDTHVIISSLYSWLYLGLHCAKDGGLIARVCWAMSASLSLEAGISKPVSQYPVAFNAWHYWLGTRKNIQCVKMSVKALVWLCLVQDGVICLQSSWCH